MSDKHPKFSRFAKVSENWRRKSFKRSGLSIVDFRKRLYEAKSLDSAFRIIDPLIPSFHAVETPFVVNENETLLTKVMAGSNTLKDLTSFMIVISEFLVKKRGVNVAYSISNNRWKSRSNGSCSSSNAVENLSSNFYQCVLLKTGSLDCCVASNARVINDLLWEMKRIIEFGFIPSNPDTISELCTTLVNYVKLSSVQNLRFAAVKLFVDIVRKSQIALDWMACSFFPKSSNATPYFLDIMDCRGCSEFLELVLTCVVKWKSVLDTSQVQKMMNMISESVIKNVSSMTFEDLALSLQIIKELIPMGGLSLYISREELSFFCHNSLRWLKSPHKKLRYASCELISGLCSRDWQCLEVTEDNFCHCFETVVSLSMEQIEHRHTTHPDLRVFLNCLGDMSQCSQFIVALDSFLVALGELLVHILDIFPGSLDFRYPKDIVNTAFWTTGQFASSLEKAKIACKIDSSVTHTLKKIYAMFEKFDFSIDKNIPRIIGNLGMTLCQIHRANNLDLERNPIFLNLCDLFAKHLEGPSFDEKSNLPITSNVIHILENLFLGFSDVIPLEKSWY
eukprot:TRINITY_DN2040_c1_g1_i4.p1 TRINITY_DN2040_c1_g1~~TRINITY_DN2040_c1_g1_i4.p1  ORF type:complete len:564 (+),score=62.11 TRINITY_DN2040_c1_g1_i4:54-1745(+)